jgi:hypothetical protein
MQSTTTQKSIAARQPLDFPSPQQGGRDMWSRLLFVACCSLPNHECSSSKSSRDVTL